MHNAKINFENIQIGALFFFELKYTYVYTNRQTTVETLPATTTHTHTHTFNGPLTGTNRVSRYQKSKTNLHFTEARDSEWQWHQPDHMQVCTSLQTDNDTSTPQLSFLQAGCPSCRPTTVLKH